MWRDRDAIPGRFDAAGSAPPAGRLRRTSDLAKLENKRTLRGGGAGGGAFPKRKGRKWKMGFAAQNGLVRVSAAPIYKQLKALSVLFPPCEWGLTREGMFLFFKEKARKYLSHTEITVITVDLCLFGH